MPATAFATIAPGLEPALVDELAEIGIRARAAQGGAEFSAEPAMVYAVNLFSRVASAVVVRLGDVPAHNLDQLAAGVRGMDWASVVWPGQPVDVHATIRSGKLRRRDQVARKVEHAIRDALRGPRLSGGRAPREAARVVVRIDRDRALVSVDASGDRLHKRGWRKATAKAPLRENLAAAVLRLAEWDPGEPLVDPMCGAGTFPIEAATICAGFAPGAHRSFAFERWPSLDAALFADLQGQAREPAPLGVSAPILAADRDPGAVKATRSNASRARVDRMVDIRHCDFAELEPPRDPGLVVANLPYGDRVGDRSRIVGFYRQIGGILRERWQGWRVALLVPGPRYAGAFGVPLDVAASFSNGGIDVCVVVGEVTGA